MEEEEETPDTPEEIDAPAPTEGPSDSQEAPGDRTTGAPNRRYQAAANYGPQQTTQLVGYNASQRSNSAVQTASQPRVLPPVISR